MAARALMEQVRTVILQRRVRETQSRSELAGAFQSRIDVLILVKGVLVSSPPGPPLLRARADAWLPGSGGQLPRMPSTQQQATPATSARLPLPACPCYLAAQGST